MPSFTDVLSGASALASDVQQIIDALKGTAGKGIPLSPTAVNDAVNFALAVKNNEAGASKGFIVYKADGTVLLQVDKNGVVASPDGTLGASQIATLTGTQTLTNKTLTAPHMTAPVVDSGGLTVTAGGLTVTAGGLTVSAGGVTVTGNSTITGTLSGVTTLTASNVTLNAVAVSVAGGQINLGSGTAASATAGTNGAPPAQVAGYMIGNVAGTFVKFPYYNN